MLRCRHNCNGKYLFVKNEELDGKLPFSRNSWGALIEVHGQKSAHAVAVGFRNSRYYIFDPKYGLFAYNRKFYFTKDLIQLIDIVQDFLSANGKKLI